MRSYSELLWQPMKRGHLILAVVAAVLATSACSQRAQQGGNEVSNRLKARLKLRSDYAVLVGVPVDKPTRWTPATSYSANEIVTAEGRFNIDSIRAFVVAYPNKQVLDMERRGLEIPDDFGFLHSEQPQEAARISVADTESGRGLIEVRYAPSTINPDTRDHYRTTLRNRSDEPVRVMKFGAFVEVDGQYVLNTVTGRFFTAAEFISWYAAPSDSWISPAMEVSDPDNYGAPPVLWAYYCETKSGKKFVTGAVLPAAWR